MKNNRTKKLEFRVSQEEKTRVLNQVNKSGFNRSEYLRRLVLESNKAIVNPTEFLKYLNGIGAEMGKSGGNINQVVKHMNVEANMGRLSENTFKIFIEALKEHNSLKEKVYKHYIKLLQTI